MYLGPFTFVLILLKSQNLYFRKKVGSPIRPDPTRSRSTVKYRSLSSFTSQLTSYFPSLNECFFRPNDPPVDRPVGTQSPPRSTQGVGGLSLDTPAVTLRGFRGREGTAGPG